MLIQVKTRGVRKARTVDTSEKLASAADQRARVEIHPVSNLSRYGTGRGHRQPIRGY